MHRLAFVKFVLSIVSLLSVNPLPAQAQKPMTISELVTYAGKDREQVLYAGAKAEGGPKGEPRMRRVIHFDSWTESKMGPSFRWDDGGVG